MKKTLAIETSCDDTSLAIVAFDGQNFICEKILSFSQIDLHAPYGGVVPELAYRSHADKIVRMIEEMAIDPDTIDFISVTSHPGLPGSLVVGVTCAHMLGQLRNKEVVEVNHIMGHVFSVLLDRSLNDLQFPYVCLTVSGGHNDIYIVEEISDTQILESASINTEDANGELPKLKRNHMAVGEAVLVGPYSVTKVAQTLDDAAGEVYDKVSRMLGGPYPGGYWMDCQAAEGGKDDRVDLRVHRLSDKPLQFSFSGIKSQVYNLLKKFEREEISLDETLIKNIAWKFQEEVSSSLNEHAVEASNLYIAKTVGVVGGVSANSGLRKKIAKEKELGGIMGNILIPTSLKYCTDNGAMIGVVGHLMRTKR